ncbi:D12 class N6 adenine-specific DNA methyltransferase [Calothrix sp. NIES-4071]|nr:D12 class N6 adenine-specific DNA methyltransferase [Calothrix sp. NIES-4071]BAZ54411.1 D12 class N6 adenine-specific DNA methyltransferase [Calothrix sp. NIES-4105]
MSKTIIKSPLRYPGGKSKAIDQIAEYIPDSLSEW